MIIVAFILTFVVAVLLEQLFAAAFFSFTPQFSLLVFFAWILASPAFRGYLAVFGGGILDILSSLRFGWWIAGFWILSEILRRLFSVVEHSRWFLVLGLVFFASAFLQGAGLFGVWLAELFRDSSQEFFLGSPSFLLTNFFLRAGTTTLCAGALFPLARRFSFVS